jgi:uncharacterized phage-like protein YoqJ
VKVVECCAFTGHRPQNLPFGFREASLECTALKQCLREQIIALTELGVTHYISGMAIGVDMYAAEIVLELKAVYPKLTLECAFLCETQAVKWSEPLRERYYNIAAQCDQETLLQTHYTAGCMQRRNQYMVDQSDFLLAVWNGRPSGTGKTVLYAQSKGRPIWCIDPKTLQVTHM